MDKTRLVIASANRLFRESLAFALNKAPGLEVIGGAADGPRVFDTALALKPDILILDTYSSDLKGIEVVRKIRSEDPDIRIITLSESAVPHYIRGMVDLGIDGYLLKSSPLKNMIKAIHSVAAGKMHLCPEVAGILVKTISSDTSQKRLFSVLSGREREVLQLIAEGYKPGDIAKKLYISPKTVQIHQSNLKKKLNLTTTAGLTKYAVSKGITPLDFIEKPFPKTR